MKLLSNNLGMKLLSLFIAIIMWIVVMNIEDPVVMKEFRNINVEVTNSEVLKEQGKVAQIIEGEIVSIQLKGNSSVIKSVNADDLVAIADLTKLSMVGAVPIEVYVTKNREQIEVIKVKKETAIFSIQSVDDIK